MNDVRIRSVIREDGQRYIHADDLRLYLLRSAQNCRGYKTNNGDVEARVLEFLEQQIPN